MGTPRTAARIDAIIWVAIYGGFFTAVLGIATYAAQPAAAWSMIGVGAIAVVAGVVLVWVRSRITVPQDKP